MPLFRKGRLCAAMTTVALPMNPINASAPSVMATLMSGITSQGNFAILATVIRVDAVWLATEPQNMQAGTEMALARVMAVFGTERPHDVYCFVNLRTDRMKISARWN